MMAPLVTALLALLLVPAVVMAQQPAAPLPLYPGAASPAITAEPLPAPSAPSAEPAGPPPAALAPGAAPPAAPVTAAPAMTETVRIFCEQPVGVRLADPDAVRERYRKFIGIWSDASWTPSLCAALIVANVTPDGTASILYVFGPLGGNSRPAGGVLRGTGLVRDGELKFQNSDGSQFVFRPLYADLEGHLTTPKGETYEAIFKQTP